MSKPTQIISQQSGTILGARRVGILRFPRHHQQRLALFNEARPGNIIMLAEVIIGVVKTCLETKERILQNRKKSRRLLENLEAIGPPLRTIDKVEYQVAHEETLQKLKAVVDDAKTLLEQQCKKSYLSQVISSKSVAEKFFDINQRLQSHMQALNLSVSVLDRVNAKSVSETDAREDLEEMQAEVKKMMQNNQDDLRKQLAELDAGQQGAAHELLANISEGNNLLRQNVSDIIDIKNLITDLVARPKMLSDAAVSKQQSEINILHKVRKQEHFLMQIWPEDADPETWGTPQYHDGVASLETRAVTIEFGRVVELRLPGKNHSKHSCAESMKVPAELWTLDALRELELEDRGISSLPKAKGIGQLTALTTLNLHNNRLVMLPSEIGQLVALEKLFLSWNRLGSLPPEIGQLSALKQVYFSGNEIKSLPPEIGQLSMLERLDLRENQLKSVPPEVGQLSRLQSLDLAENQLQSVPPEVGQLSRLEFLTLNGNQLKSVPPEVGQLSRLQSLDLRDNQLRALPCELGELHSLFFFCVAGNPVRRIPQKMRHKRFGLRTDDREDFIMLVDPVTGDFKDPKDTGQDSCCVVS